MTDEVPVGPAAHHVLDPRAIRALAALLSINAADVAGIRERSPSRRRPNSQYGPQLDLGEQDGATVETALDGSVSDSP